jgi:hypothetical protein
VTNLSGSIAAGGYYLVQEAQGGGGTTPLPTPDATGTISMAASNGKVALVTSTTALAGTCPTDTSIADLVGFGTANCFEGSGATPALSNTNSAQRDAGGCADSDDNAADFAVAAPVPQNSASAPVGCGCGTVNETGFAEEADYCNLQFPVATSATASTPTALIYGQIFETGVTEAAGDSGTVTAEVGYGPLSANPEYDMAWVWTAAAYNVQVGNNDEYQASFLAPATPGEYYYTYRFSLDGGSTWTYCDVNGAGSNTGLSFETTQLGVLTVTP